MSTTIAIFTVRVFLIENVDVPCLLMAKCNVYSVLKSNKVMFLFEGSIPYLTRRSARAHNAFHSANIRRRRKLNKGKILVLLKLAVSLNRTS